MMNIVTGGGGEDINHVVNYFDFNLIPYTQIDLWDGDIDQMGRHTMNNSLLEKSNTLLVINSDIFFPLCNWDYSRQQLIKFCKSNKLWVMLDYPDALKALLSQHVGVTALDSCVEPASINLFIDGGLLSDHVLSNLKNILIDIVPYPWHLSHIPRIQNTRVDKINCSRDFMCTMVKKANRPHRDILWDQINEIPGLSDCGHINYNLGKIRIGQQNPHYTYSDNHPSMDLYRDAWLEIVPENMYCNGYALTEKTIKPMITKTPFLTVSTQYYLQYLRNHGFRTFNHIIDEKYDCEPRVEDRVRLMLIQLQDIIRNGSEKFYDECADVLEHNQNRLFYIKGRKEYDYDIFIAKKLTKLGII
jgi:hypothetical protein